MEVCCGECATVVMMRLIAKSLDGDARPHVMERRSLLKIDVARPLWDGNVLGLDQEAGRRLDLLFPGNTRDFVSAPLLSQCNVIGFPRL